MTGADAIEDRLREVRARIDHIERTQRELETALDEIDHRMRRLSDGLEREGGRAPALEAERRRLGDNRAHDARERERNRARLAELRAEADALAERRAGRG